MFQCSSFHISLAVLIVMISCTGFVKAQKVQYLLDIQTPNLQDSNQTDFYSRKISQILSSGESSLSIESAQVLEKNRTQRLQAQCDPETNIYPCGALQFLGCSGNKKLYAQSSIRLNWFEAWEFCRSNDMHLASILSNYEQILMELFLPQPETGSTEGYWVSGTDFGREGRFFWMSTGQLFTFTNWRHGEPNNYGGIEHCVQVTANAATASQGQDTMKWNDLPCTLVAYAICEEYLIQNET